MDSTRKLWLLILLGVCVLILQYHVSTTWNSNGLGGPSYAPTNSEELVLAAVSRLQLDPSVANTVGRKYLREIAIQLGRDLLSTRGCDLSLSSSSSSGSSSSSSSAWPEPTLYIITPTYRRPEQIAELTRMAQTLMHVRNLVWLVIEDATKASTLVTKLLDKTGIEYHHLVAPMPEQYKKKKVKPRGVSNRNRGLEWIRANATKGVLYFADDDNTYDISLFQEVLGFCHMSCIRRLLLGGSFTITGEYGCLVCLPFVRSVREDNLVSKLLLNFPLRFGDFINLPIRTTRKVSMFPVGLCTKFGVSTPIVKNGSFAGFYDGWIGGRKFPVDMAGFAVNLDFLFQRPNASMPYKPGFEEDGFLRSLSPFEPKEMELKADNCTKILVWHTQTKKNEPSSAVDLNKYGNTNIVKLKQILV